MPNEPTDLTFSQRMELSPVRKALQIDSMDEALRNGLWNVISEFLFEPLSRRLKVSESQFGNLTKWIWTEHFNRAEDSLPGRTRDAVMTFRNYFYSVEWNAVYDLIEFAAKRLQDPYMRQCNVVLERQSSAYRFVGKRLVRLTSEQEIAAVEAATAFSDLFKPVSDHLNSALEKLSNRAAPDYRNSIKESISAVEAICCIITGTKATLGQAVKKLKGKGVEIHPAFEGALEKMYGYTSDAEGIRHALLNDPTLDSADALFMLVSCSAFVNYLKSKYAKTE